MDENDKKDLEEAVEKIITKNEERKRASMSKSPEVIPIEKKHLAKKASSPEKKKMGSTILLVVIIAGLLTYMAWDEYGPEVEPEIVIVYPANVVLGICR